MSAWSECTVAALEYGELGLAVLPVGKKSKAPTVKGGYKSATKERAKILRVFQSRPDANVGIATGGQSGLLVLDIDPRNGGDDSLAALENEHGPLPPTVTALTGGGGRHFYFSHEGDQRSGVLANGLDVKADGGYVVAPPSVHPSGREYAWHLGPREVEFAPVPDWVLEKLAGKRTPGPPQASIDAADSPLGRLFAELSVLGKPLDGGKRAVLCPWQSTHTTGRPLDSSTVIFPRSKPDGLGGFHCSHAHCAGRTATEAFHELQRQRDDGLGVSSWRSELKNNEKTGVALNTFWNVCLILKNDEAYGAKLRADELNAKVLLDGAAITDAAISRLRLDLDSRYGVQVNEAEAVRAVHYVAVQNRFHPVRDFLNSLVWDGEPRIDRVAEDVLAVRLAQPDDLPIMTAMVRRWFVALVARPLSPGLKVDTALILQGSQGTGKSTFFRVLAGEWFSDTEMGLDKDGMMLLGGAWICEWAELENVMSRNAVSKVKAFLTSTEDRFRPPFGRTPITVKRSGIIVGSTNLDDFLHDATGSRRFWVIPVGRVNVELLREWREQILAESVALWKRKEPHWLTEEEESRRLALVGQFAESDPWEQDVLRYAGNGPFVRVCDILSDALGLEKKQQTKREERRVADILRRAGWVPRHQRINGAGPFRVWTPPSTGTGGTNGTPSGGSR